MKLKPNRPSRGGISSNLKRWFITILAVFAIGACAVQAEAKETAFGDVHSTTTYYYGGDSGNLAEFWVQSDTPDWEVPSLPFVAPFTVDYYYFRGWSIFNNDERDDDGYVSYEAGTQLALDEFFKVDVFFRSVQPNEFLHYPEGEQTWTGLKYVDLLGELGVYQGDSNQRMVRLGLNKRWSDWGAYGWCEYVVTDESQWNVELTAERYFHDDEYSVAFSYFDSADADETYALGLRWNLR